MSRRKRFTRNLGRKLKSPLPARTTVEWIRFEHRDVPYGIFSYLGDARDFAIRTARDEIDTLSDWFNEHLRVPKGLTIERCWFRAEAEPYVRNARRLATLLWNAGIPIVERRTKRIPGKVKYEDEHQVVVFTFRDTLQPSNDSRAFAGAI